MPKTLAVLLKTNVTTLNEDMNTSSCRIVNQTDPWSVKISVIYSDWEQLARSQSEVFHTKCYLILLTGDIRA